MKSFKSWDDIQIIYHEWGGQSSSPPVVLHHGFVVDANVNWVAQASSTRCAPRDAE
jgi:pimeloyl-ACP methyl ester carboxylesterase